MSARERTALKTVVVVVLFLLLLRKGVLLEQLLIILLFGFVPNYTLQQNVLMNGRLFTRFALHLVDAAVPKTRTGTHLCPLSPT